MRFLTFLSSRSFRWPLAIVMCLAAMVLLVATRAESGAPFGLVMIAAFIAYDG